MTKKFRDKKEADDRRFRVERAVIFKEEQREEAEKDRVDSMKRAARYEGNGDWKTARNNYRHVVETHPNTPEATKAAAELERIEREHPDR